MGGVERRSRAARGEGVFARARLGVRVVALALVVGVAEAQAQTQEDLRFRVYVAQRLEFLPDPDLSRESVPQLDSARLVRAVERYFGQHPERFVVVPGDALLDAYDDPGSPVSPLRFLRSASQGNSSLERGIKSLSRFDLPEAERNLLDAASNYEAVQAPLLLPQELARVYEYLGQVYAEEGRREEAVEAFVRMSRLDGRRVLVHPYYHEETEALYREGRAKLLEGRRRGPTPRTWRSWGRSPSGWGRASWCGGMWCSRGLRRCCAW